jgi:hypothetical protein
VQTIHQPKRLGALAWANDVTDADAECGKRRAIHTVRCGGCKRNVMLHCDQCRIQVTGCLCTLIERMEPIEAYKVLAKQVGQERARREMATFGYPNMPYLPGLPM